MRRLLGVVLIVVVGLTAGWYFWWYRDETRVAQRDVENTIAAIGKLYELPDEIPVHATVTDTSKLTSQPFFAEAENGDKVLVYNQAKKVILFRPRTNKLINVSNLNPGELQVEARLPDQQTEANPNPEPTPQPPAAEPAPPASVVILNGTAIAGLTQQVQQQLIERQSQANVISRGNAQERTYTQTLVIALTAEGETVAPAYAAALAAQVADLPAGESTPSADILIIAGTSAANQE